MSPGLGRGRDGEDALMGDLLSDALIGASDGSRRARVNGERDGRSRSFVANVDRMAGTFELGVDRQEGTRAERSRAGGSDGGGAKRKRAESAQFPGRVVRRVMEDGDDDRAAPGGWDDLCDREFECKKTARVGVVEWYSKTSASSARLIVDKWRESKVRYVLRCQRAMPKRQEKGNKEVCKSISGRCAMCVNIVLDKDAQVWRVSRSESVPCHDPSCEDSTRPNVSSVQFAAALVGIEHVPAERKHEFINRVLKETGYKISSGTKQRAIALAEDNARKATHGPLR